MAGVRVLAYAKLNLVLRVVGRRADGYHLLQSLMVAVDLADEVELARGGQGVELSAPTDIGPPEGNLAFRAARALLGHRDVGVRIALRKRIPTGAGLGGGSADAAAVLAGLNELLGLGHSPAELQAVGVRIGADVPFFLGPSPAWVEGIGDRVTPVEVELPGAFVIVVPRFGCPTADVYRTFDALGLPFAPPAPPPKELAAFPNDLWPAATRLRPELVRLRATLAEISSRGVSMTGSGSALFVAFPSREEAHAAREEVEAKVDGTLFVAVPVPRGYNIQR